VWVPADEDELRSAVDRGDVAETASFDAKEALPPPGKNVDVAIDIAAMSTDGGVLLYGVGEDEHGQPTRLTPMPLAGAAERIDSVRLTGIAEPPDIVFHPIPSAEGDGLGYLAVIVPASPRAPHMVTVGKQARYYGRGATGNRMLLEADVARLYARRQRWDRDAGAVLEAAIAAAPIPQHDDLVSLHVIIAPLTAAPDTLERAAAGEQARQWVSTVTKEADSSAIWPTRVHDFASFARVVRTPTGYELVAGTDDPIDPQYVRRLSFDDDGGLRLYEARVGARYRDEDILGVFEDAVPERVTRTCWLAHRILTAAGYVGQVDTGVAVTNLEGAITSQAMLGGHWRHPYPDYAYRRTARVQTAALSQPSTVAKHLSGRLVQVLSQGTRDGFEALRR
jgi:hypothetical protein